MASYYNRSLLEGYDAGSTGEDPCYTRTDVTTSCGHTWSVYRTVGRPGEWTAVNRSNAGETMDPGFGYGIDFQFDEEAYCHGVCLPVEVLAEVLRAEGYTVTR